MKRIDEQLALDTNILIHWLRGTTAATRLRDEYAIGARVPRPIIPIVVKGEIKSLATSLAWGTQKRDALDALLRELPIADISHESVVAAYAEIDTYSRSIGRKMGKNDLWIAAIASVQGAVILTTDQDFDHLHPEHVTVEYIDATTLLAP